MRGFPQFYSKGEFVPKRQGGEARMKPREGKHAPEPRGGFPGGNRPPGKGGLPAPSGLPPGSSVFTLQVRLFDWRPRTRGGFCFRLQVATGLHAVDHGAAVPPCFQLGRPPRCGAPGLFGASRPRGRSSPRASVSVGQFLSLTRNSRIAAPGPFKPQGFSLSGPDSLACG